MKKITQELIFIRHGQASFGAADYDNLSSLGHEQTRHLGVSYASFLCNEDVIVSGAMKRHQQTACNIANACELSVSETLYPEFNEFAFEAVIAAYFSLYPNEKPPSDAPRSAFYRVLKNAMLAWSQDALGDGLPETFSQFQERVISGASIVAEQYSHAQRIIVSTSGGAIAMLLGHVLSLSIDKIVQCNLQIYNASCHRFLYTGKQLILTGFNDVSHFRDKTEFLTYS